MAYDYVRRNYGVDPIVGHRVRHTEIDKLGTIAREDAGQGHRVMVKFDGQKFASPCHPTALDYSIPQPPPSVGLDCTVDAQIAEAKRELGLRYGVYKKQVAFGSLTQALMDERIALQRAIIASLEKLKRLAEAPGVLT